MGGAGTPVPSSESCHLLAFYLTSGSLSSPDVTSTLLLSLNLRRTEEIIPSLPDFLRSLSGNSGN